jgi:hypothetical protein
MEKAADGGLTGLVNAAKAVAYPAAALALAAPPTLGGLAAYFKNKATDSDASDRRMADQLRRAKALRERKAGKKRSGQVFL